MYVDGKGEMRLWLSGEKEKKRRKKRTSKSKGKGKGKEGKGKVKILKYWEALMKIDPSLTKAQAKKIARETQ